MAELRVIEGDALAGSRSRHPSTRRVSREQAAAGQASAVEDTLDRLRRRHAADAEIGTVVRALIVEMQRTGLPIPMARLVAVVGKADAKHQPGGGVK